MEHIRDESGILDARNLPEEQFDSFWDSIIVGNDLKDRLLSQAILTFTAKKKFDRAKLPIHGVILLKGPPGTGKTSLAKGLASRTAASLQGIEEFQFLEVEPHELTSSSLGKSQKAVQHLMDSIISEQSAAAPLIVLLDEVETLAGSRADMSLEANPIDVHRATDAVLTQLDNLSQSRENLLFIATSNFPEALDDAFLSRVDLVEEIGLPNKQAAEEILMDSLAHLIESFPSLNGIENEPEISEAINECEGLDGREIRKAVLHACAQDKSTAMDPSNLSASDLLSAVQNQKNSKK